MTTLKSYRCDNCKVTSLASGGGHGPKGWATFLLQVISDGPVGGICPSATRIHICDDCVVNMPIGNLLNAVIEISKSTPLIAKMDVFGNRVPKECTDDRPKGPR